MEIEVSKKQMRTKASIVRREKPIDAEIDSGVLISVLVLCTCCTDLVFT
jgi:hypothetical protein